MTVLKSVFRRPLRRVSGRGPSRGLSPQALDRGGGVAAQTQDPQSRPGAPSAHLRSSAPVFFSRLKNVPLGLLELSLFF